MSVAEAEFRAGVKGAAILLGAKSMMIDFGEDVAQCVLGTDSSSAKSIMERRGARRIRHLHCPMPGCKNVLTLVKFKGEDNTEKAVIAPILRKHWKNVEDGVARWTTPVGVECGYFCCNGLSGTANFVKLRMTCHETLECSSMNL